MRNKCIKIDEGNVEKVDKYKYIGCLITNNLDTDVEIKLDVDMPRQSLKTRKTCYVTESSI